MSPPCRSRRHVTGLTARDKQRVAEVMAHYGVNATGDTEDEVPWSRGRREAAPRDARDARDARDDAKPFCILQQPDERTTGGWGR